MSAVTGLPVRFYSPAEFLPRDFFRKLTGDGRVVADRSILTVDVGLSELPESESRAASAAADYLVRSRLRHGPYNNLVEVHMVRH